MPQVACPHCQQPFSLSNGHAQTIVRCPACGHALQRPTLQRPTLQR
ncbi:MAG: hypothetical protein KDA99_26915, partial [Planctomycetales bacterium]|nr:hypothetical protein [Planctomycetales bacterium]